MMEKNIMTDGCFDVEDQHIICCELVKLKCTVMFFIRFLTLRYHQNYFLKCVN